MDKKKGQKKDRQRGWRMLKKYRFELELGALCVVFVACPLQIWGFERGKERRL